MDGKIQVDPEFEKLGEKFRKVYEKSPDLIKNRFNKVGREVKKELQEVTPSRDTKKNPKKKLKNAWVAGQTKEENGVFTKPIYQNYKKAKHYHLVERGHNIVPRRAKKKGGRKGEQYRVKHTSTKSRVEGKFFFEKYMDKKEPDIEKEFEKIIDDLFENLLG